MVNTALTENQPTNIETNYIHINLNHRPSVIKKNSMIIWKRDSILSSSKNIFQESAIYYEKCLKSSGYKTKLQYQQPKEKNQNKKKRKRNMSFDSIHNTESPLKPISREYSSN